MTIVKESAGTRRYDGHNAHMRYRLADTLGLPIAVCANVPDPTGAHLLLAG